MEDLHGARIAYVPFDETLTRPGDRRRFCYYAKKRNLKFEFADPAETYDFVIVSAGGDISLWGRYCRGNAKVIYDLTDSYLAIPKSDTKELFRGLAKYVVRQNRHLLWSYSGGLRSMCDRADAVICTTAEQRLDILPHCDNVHIILDFQGSAVRTIKTDYLSGDVCNLVWEGLGGNFATLHEISSVLGEFNSRRRIALHAITNLSFGQYLGGRFVQRRTQDMARRIPVPVYLYAWNEYTFSAIACSCDLAVIPIPLGDPLYAGKPENKLHLFWRMGVPALTSATPAYSRAMRQAGLAMQCLTSEDWLSGLERYCGNDSELRTAGQSGRRFVLRDHNEEAIVARWDAVFSSILSSSAAVGSLQQTSMPVP